jgi:hypothetical protein
MGRERARLAFFGDLDEGVAGLALVIGRIDQARRHLCSALLELQGAARLPSLALTIVELAGSRPVRLSSACMADSLREYAGSRRDNSMID